MRAFHVRAIPYLAVFFLLINLQNDDKFWTAVAELLNFLPSGIKLEQAGMLTILSAVLNASSCVYSLFHSDMPLPIW